MPTSGSVIGTGDHNFMDGSVMRMPRNAWFRVNMKSIELDGAQPDIFVPLYPEHVVRREDPQLERAVRVLMDGL
jgi:C-terminal processing protease CtpA/Prc